MRVYIYVYIYTYIYIYIYIYISKGAQRRTATVPGVTPVIGEEIVIQILQSGRNPSGILQESCRESCRNLNPAGTLQDSCRIPLGFLQDSCRIPAGLICRNPAGFREDACRVDLGESSRIPAGVFQDSCMIPAGFPAGILLHDSKNKCFWSPDSLLCPGISQTIVRNPLRFA